LNLQQCHCKNPKVKNFEIEESKVNWNGYTIRAFNTETQYDV